MFEYFYDIWWGAYFDAKIGIRFYIFIHMHIYTLWCGLSAPEALFKGCTGVPYTSKS